MKSNYLIILGLLLFLVVACTKQANDLEDDNQVITDINVQKNLYKDINLAKMEALISNKESFYIVFSTTYCSYCKAFFNLYENGDYLNNTKLYRVILDNETNTEDENLAIIHKYFSEFSTTPGLFRVMDGENMGYADFSVTGLNEEILTKWFVENPID